MFSSTVCFYVWTLTDFTARIQTEENSQNTPDCSNIDLFAGIHHTVVTLSEQEDTSSIDCKIYQPLVLKEKSQH